MTNLNKTREEIIYELLLSLNRGNEGYFDRRVHHAVLQYNQLKEEGIIRKI